MDASSIDALIDDRIANLEKGMRSVQAQATATIALYQSKVAALRQIKGNIADRDIALYRLLRDEGILQELTR